LARQLLALSSAPLDWGRYRDTRAEELTALLHAKIAQQPAAPPAEEPVLLPLLEALKQSVAQVRDAELASAAATAAPKPRARRKSG
jgi:non-homologous end joining protein Ku